MDVLDRLASRLQFFQGLILARSCLDRLLVYYGGPSLLLETMLGDKVVIVLTFFSLFCQFVEGLVGVVK